MRLLNLGGGNKTSLLPDAYADCTSELMDIWPNPDVDILCDARDLRTQPPEVYDIVYCSHMLEHFDPWDVPIVLDGIRHVLNGQGFVDVRVPNVAQAAKTLAETENLDTVAYISATGIPVTIGHLFYGYSPDIRKSESMRHKHGFTPKMLKQILEAYFPFIGIGVQPDAMEIRAIGSKLPIQETTNQALRKLIGKGE